MTARPEARWALVSGATRGIGRAVALELADRHWNIAGVYLQNDKAADDLADLVHARDRQLIRCRANLSNPAECREVVERVRNEVGSLNGFVHCAALGALSPTLATRPSRWRLTWESHVGGFLEIVANARPLLARGSGVVALTSLGSSRVMDGYASIGATKGALEVLVRYLAAELSKDGVHVNAVCGGPVDTDSLRSFSSFEALAEDSRRRPCERLGTPEDLAPVVAFLLGAEAHWIRGQVVVADGGFGLY